MEKGPHQAANNLSGKEQELQHDENISMSRELRLQRLFFMNFTNLDSKFPFGHTKSEVITSLPEEEPNKKLNEASFIPVSHPLGLN